MLVTLAMHLLLLRSYAYQDEIVFNDRADNRYSIVCVSGTIAFQFKVITPRYDSPFYIRWFTLTPAKPAMRMVPFILGRKMERALPAWANRGVGYHEEEDSVWAADEGFPGSTHRQYHDYRLIIQFGPTQPGG